ncbi:hypothetical protein ACR3H8_20555 [Pseudomonas aeruginosa]|uniref:hypothetical protein n=1 Tax=Pseudomonas aeruginosa group TaxID=136841 RepID=UPI0003BB2C24|nr:hypothetical protein [Pseudomonas aeruginosa]ELD5772909.1 hypothetical protein [Pseudomonas aeruginosa]ERW61266.1 hypothetical protein Q024_06313 [Pseudomonas aeruginosa BWHPSA011]ETV28739.1 hypothetical protein Q046_05656 [Pseudomonas aeruginosa BWHPSA041]ETV55993.1 hypothetical protein Q042_05402 [Pseudomonas aeruginosa BWHPSA037]MBA5210244.1 hypothetical protein [Pseudomonas aeruginosa]
MQASQKPNAMHLSNDPMLTMDFEAMLLPELEQMPHWAQTYHQMLMELDPARLMQLSSSGELLKHLMSHHDQMVELELELMREWKLKHPAKENQTMQEAAGRNQQAKMHAKEVIREDMENSIRLYALETSQKA